MLAGNVLQTLYSLVNGVWVGKLLGATALAAVTVSMPLVFVLNALVMGLTMAANILVAQYAGARDWSRLRSAVQTSIVIITGLSLVFMVVGMALAGPLLAFIKTPPEVLGAATRYLQIFLLTVPLSFGIFLTAALLRGIGDSKTPVYFQSVSLVINAVLDPILMFGWLGMPKLGLNGTAWATIVSQAIAVAGLVVYTAKKRPLVMPHWRELRVDGATAGRLLVIGLPTAIQHSIISLSMLFLTSVVNRFGGTTVAAFGAGLRIDGVAFMPAMTMGVAVSSLAGQNIGARRYERATEVWRWGNLLSGGISLAIAVVIFAFPRLFLRAFMNSEDPHFHEELAVGVGYLRIMCVTYVLYAVMFVGNGVINGSGQTIITTAFTVVSLGLVRVPLVWWLPEQMGSVTGVWWAMVLSVCIGATLSTGYYFTGRWKHSIAEPDLALREAEETPPITPEA